MKQSKTPVNLSEMMILSQKLVHLSIFQLLKFVNCIFFCFHILNWQKIVSLCCKLLSTFQWNIKEIKFTDSSLAPLVDQLKKKRLMSDSSHFGNFVFGESYQNIT